MPFPCSRSLRVLLAVMATLAAAAGRAEQLDYRVTYRGALSLGEEVPIADVRLLSAPPTSRASLRETRLEASSAAYPLVESLFPMRYRFRSWADAGDGRLVGFEAWERTRRQRHRLYLRDGAEDVGVRRFDLEAGKGRDALAQLAAGVRPQAAAAAPLFDRLGMLQWLRAQPLRVGAEFRLPVTDGSDRLAYRARVEAEQALALGGDTVAAWKVRLDASERKADGRWEQAHRPVYLWIGRAPGQIPLRVDSRTPFGLFRVERVPGGAAAGLDVAAR